MGQELRFSVTGLSGTVFPVFAGLLVVLAWQYPFYMYALALPIAAALVLWFDEPTTPDTTAETSGDGSESYRRAMFQLVRRHRALALLIARALPLVIWYAFITYNSLIVIRILGGTAPQAGLLAAIGSLVFAITGSQAGRITARSENRLYPLLGANVCLGVGFAIVLFAFNLVVAICGIMIAGVGFGITMSLYRSILTGLPPEYLRAGFVRVTESGGRVSATATPILMGAVISAATPMMGLSPRSGLPGSAPSLSAQEAASSVSSSRIPPGRSRPSLPTTPNPPPRQNRRENDDRDPGVPGATPPGDRPSRQTPTVKTIRGSLSAP